MQNIKAFWRKYRTALIAALAVLAVAGSFVFSLTAVKAQSELVGRACFIGLLVLAALVVCGLFLLKDKIKTATLFLVTILLAGLIYMAVFPAYTVPDEHLHYFTAYSYTNPLLGVPYSRDAFLMRRVDEQFFRDISEASTIACGIEVSTAEYAIDRAYADHLFVTDEEAALIQTEFHTVYNRGLTYVPATIGVLLARLCRLNALATFQLGRLFNLLFYAVVVCFAIRLAPVGKAALGVIACLPMSLHLAASYSYDGYNIAMSLFVFSLILSLIFRKEPIRVSEMVFTTAVACLAIPFKMIYIVLLPVVWFVPRRLFSRKWVSVVFKIAMVILPAIGCVLLQFGKLTGSEVSILNEGVQMYTIDWILHHIPETVVILLRTVRVNAKFYLTSALASKMGWLQLLSPPWLLWLLLLVLLGSMIGEKGSEAALKGGSVVSLLLAVCGAFAAIGILMLDCTPMGEPVVAGVQGRYFIPLMPLGILLLGNRYVTRGQHTDELFGYGMLALNGITALELLERLV